MPPSALDERRPDLQSFSLGGYLQIRLQLTLLLNVSVSRSALQFRFSSLIHLLPTIIIVTDSRSVQKTPGNESHYYTLS